MSTPSFNPPGLIQLVYASAASVSFDDDQLLALLDQARNRNASLNVTGVLLFKDGTFFQVLEGPSDLVDELYQRISMDTRHGNVLLLAKRNIEERNFGQWAMGFVQDADELNCLEGFVDFLDDASTKKVATCDQSLSLELLGDSTRMKQTLEGFRRGRWRRQPSPPIAAINAESRIH